MTPLDTTRTFDLLTPHAILDTVESAWGLRLDGSLSAYPSYVNRVFAVTSEDGAEYVAKFYRPGRWTEEAILDEHQFVQECAEAELPVAVPLPDADGATLQSAELEGEQTREEFFFALYTKKGGLAFDAERDEDWRRLGSLVARLHTVAVRAEAPHRIECSPAVSSARFLRELVSAGVMHPKCEKEFFGLAEEALAEIRPLFEGVPLHRIHGDCHRGNILDRPGEGLLVIDFDDMMNGPAVQDLWLLLPDRAGASRRQLASILEGYEELHPFDSVTLRLIEPLRLMRMLYFLAWSARQRDDRRFRESNPGWGTEAFWIREIEDLRDQREAIAKGS